MCNLCVLGKAATQLVLPRACTHMGPAQRRAAHMTPMDTQVEGFELIPMSELATRVEDVPKDRPVFVMCHHGMRSMQVTRYLRTKGLRAVSNIEGGIEAWSTRIDPSVARY